jgi:uncharacterized protein (TIGR02145 family)
MKTFILSILILFCNQLIFSQKITLHRNTGGDQTFELSSVDSITFLPFVCGQDIIYEGKTYGTVLIGTQCWMKENLNVGTMIQGNSNQSNNGVKEKYCYNNDTANCSIYGGLYQWNEAMQYITTEGARGICPEGWHVPTRAQFITLSESVGWLANALVRQDQGINSTNTSGFSGLYAGFRDFSYFNQLATHTYFWSTTPDEYGYAYMSLSNYANPYFNSAPSYCGTSIRCLKD